MGLLDQAVNWMPKVFPINLPAARSALNLAALKLATGEPTGAPMRVIL